MVHGALHQGFVTLVREHPTAGESTGCGAFGKRGSQKSVSLPEAIATPSGRAVFHLRRILPERKSLSPIQLGPLLHLAEASLASEFVLLGRHLDIVLRVAQRAVLGEEGTVTTVQDIQIGVGELRVVVRVESAILVTNVLGHNRGAMGRVFAVEDQGRPRLGCGEELGGQVVLVVVVDSAIDMASLVLIFKAAVDDHHVVKTIVVFPIQELHQDVFVDTRQCICLVLRKDVRKLQAGGSFNVDDRREWCICN